MDAEAYETPNGATRFALRVFTKMTGFAFLFVVYLAACGPSTEPGPELEKRAKRFLAAYCSTDVKEAEKGLLDDVKEYEELQRRGVVGLDYDHAFKLNHFRLAVLYKQTGRTNEALHHFHKGLSHRNTAQVRREGNVFTGSLDEVEAGILKLDAALDVKWRKNLKRDSNGSP